MSCELDIGNRIAINDNSIEVTVIVEEIESGKRGSNYGCSCSNSNGNNGTQYFW